MRRVDMRKARTGRCLEIETMRNPGLAPFITVAAVAFAAGPVAAHARLVSATPAPNATVAAPRTISLTFNERSVPAFSGFDVVNAAGEKVAIRTAVAEDGKTLTGTLARPLLPGTYTVEWRIASSDGHRMTGSYAFSVR
jgi:methionine-rich copper-binding protein CopC